MTRTPIGRQRSAGLLVFRRRKRAPEFLLAHPGGPFWARKDAGVWSIPKGLVNDGEDDLAAARREFQEEVGIPLDGAFTALAEQKQKSGKRVACWMVEAELDLSQFHSNTFDMEWPPRSGRFISAPECDRAAYFAVDQALIKILEGQQGFIDEATRRLRAGASSPKSPML
jgi:predicted NUDIX family NTP pyrophosphohydrolase